MALSLKYRVHRETKLNTLVTDRLANTFSTVKNCNILLPCQNVGQPVKIELITVIMTSWGLLANYYFPIKYLNYMLYLY